jgi:hypothetical protein
MFEYSCSIFFSFIGSGGRMPHGGPARPFGRDSAKSRSQQLAEGKIVFVCVCVIKRKTERGWERMREYKTRRDQFLCTHSYVYAYIIPGRWIFACIAPMGIPASSGCCSNAAYGNIRFGYNKILYIRSTNVKNTVKTDLHYQYYDRLQLIDRRLWHGVTVWSIMI